MLQLKAKMRSRYTKMIKQLTSNTSYFIVCEATCFGLYVTIIRPSYESSQINADYPAFIDFIRKKADDVHIRTETCSLTHNKI